MYSRYAVYTTDFSDSDSCLDLVRSEDSFTSYEEAELHSGVNATIVGFDADHDVLPQTLTQRLGEQLAIETWKCARLHSLIHELGLDFSTAMIAVNTWIDERDENRKLSYDKLRMRL